MNEKKNINKKALKSGVWYTVSNFLIKGIGFITTPIFTRLLSKEEFGIYSNYSSWLSIITIFVTLNLQSTLISARYDYEEKFDEYIFSMLGLSTLTTAIALGITNIFPKHITSFFQLEPIYINAMLVYLLFLPAISLFQSRERYLFEYKISVLLSLVIAVSTAGLSVIMVIAFSNRLTGRVFGAVIPTIIVGIILYLFFIIKGKRLRISYWKYALPICLPYIPHLLSMSLLNNMDRVMITRLCGSEKNALYSLAYNCGAIVSLFFNAINEAYSPWLAQKLNDEKYDSITEFSKKYMFCVFVFVILAMLLTPEVLFILGGKPYMEAVYVLAPVAMGCFCQFLYTMFVNIEQFYKKTIGMAIASVIAAITNLILNLFFIPKIGYLAAAYTTLVGFICLLLIHMYLVRRIGKAFVYSYKCVFLLIGLGIILMIGITFLYSNNIMRYIVLFLYSILILLFLVRNKQKVNFIFKSILK